MSQNETALAIPTKMTEISQLPAMLPKGDTLESPQVMAHLMILSQRMAQSALVPEAYRGKPAEIFIALDNARTLGVNAFHYMQKTYVHKGKVGMESTLILSLLRKSKNLKGTLKYEVVEEGKVPNTDLKNLRIRAWGHEAETGDLLQGPWIDLKMAQSEGWLKNSKYLTMPETMLRYRAISFFTKQFFPEVLNGMMDANEIYEDEPVRTSAPPVLPPENEELQISNETPPERDHASNPADDKSKEPKEGSLDWFKKNLEEAGISFKSSARRSDLKALWSAHVESLKESVAEKEEVEPEEVPELPPQIEDDNPPMDDGLEDDGPDFNMFPEDD